MPVKKKVKVNQNIVIDQMTIIKNKFSRLAAIRQQLAETKPLYQEHDQLMQELLPLFITRTPTQFIIEREITIGTEKHRLVPYFFDDKKNILVAKQWKSVAFNTAEIE